MAPSSVGTRKFLEVQIIFAQISPKISPRKMTSKNKKKLHFHFFQIKALQPPILAQISHKFFLTCPKSTEYSKSMTAKK